MKKQYTRKQIVEAINYWKKQLNSKELDESSNAAKKAFEAAIAKMPKEEQDFLFNGNFSGNALAEGTDFRLTTYFTLTLTPEIFQNIGYKAFDIPIYAEGMVDNAQTAVFFKKGQQDKFLADFANLCKTDKELFYGLKYGLLYIDDGKEEWVAEQIEGEFSDHPEIEKLCNDPSFECIFFRVCCPRFDDEPGDASSEPLVKKVCQLAGVKPLPKSQIDKLVELEREVEDEDDDNYEEDQRFKWDKFFQKIGAQADGADLIRNNQIGSVSGRVISKDDYDYTEFLRKAKNKRADISKVNQNWSRFSKCLCIKFSSFSNHRPLPSEVVNAYENLAKKMSKALGKFSWFAGPYVFRWAKQRGPGAEDVIAFYAFIFADNFPETWFH